MSKNYPYKPIKSKKNTKSIKNITQKVAKIELHEQMIENKLKQFKKKDGTKQTKKIGDYLENLINPEIALSPRFPIDGYSKPSIPFSRKITVRSQTNDLGCLYFIWQPFFLSDDTNAKTTFAINNLAGGVGTGYDGTSTGLTLSNLKGVVLNYSCPQNNIEGYRLVSACVTMTLEAPNQTRTGRALIAKHAYPTPAPVANGSAFAVAIYQTNDMLFSTVDNFIPRAAGQLGNGDIMRAIYTPIDIHDTEFTPLNTEVDSNNSGTEDFIVGYIANATINTPVTFDFWLHYEVIPQGGSVLQGMESITTDKSDFTHTLLHVNQHTDLVVNKITTAARYGIVPSSTVKFKDPGSKFKFLQ